MTSKIKMCLKSRSSRRRDIYLIFITSDDPLTSVTIDENGLLPRHMCVVVLVADGHCEGAGHRFGWMAAVAHGNGDEELFLPLAVKGPQGCECRRAI